MPFTFTPDPDLKPVVLVEPRAFGDNRGWFMETYKRSDFERAGILGDFRQDNHSLSKGKGILRGLHFQNDPKAQGKLVRVGRGAIWDVVVDLRKGSPTYRRWKAFELTADNRRILWVPPGFGHGFCTLSDEAEVIYKTTNEYDAALDRSVRWDDPDLGVQWPVKDPILSEKDLKAPPLAKSDVNFQAGA
ncbi:MAG: dTDP-4-dehydrorhamnose 3,5-epimerase [Thermoplasmata archaeon]|jgi:dTDP-4-dehydrorhamnose 3,5-epimerase|nr:dTDP-4-dehydrorhamnose 3,5-epimerase [Thermoplasmata archaeon]